MELLLVLIGELIAGVTGFSLVAALTVVVEALVAAITLGVEVTCALIAARHHREAEAPGLPPTPKVTAAAPRTRTTDDTNPRSPAVVTVGTAPRRRSARLRTWSRRILVVGLGLLTFTIGGLAVVNIWFLDDALRWALLRHEQRSGVAIGFTGVAGNLFTGTLHFDGLTVRKPGPAATNYDLRVETVNLDLRMRSALFGTVVIDELALRGIGGSVTRTPPTVKRSGVTIKGYTIELGSDRHGIEIHHPPRKSGRPFTIARLIVERADIAIADVRTAADGDEVPLTYRLEINRLASAPLRRDSLLFDALYRTNASGRIDGAAFTLATGERSGGRWTTWDFSAVPAPMLAMLGGPLRLITGGTCALRADDTWTDGADRRIDMRYRLLFTDLRVALPDSWTGLRRTLATPVVALLQRRGARLPLEFSCVLDRNRLDQGITLELCGLGEALWTGIGAALDRP